MDNAYYEDLAGRLYGLVIRLVGRLPPDEAQWLHHVVEVGEYGLALEDMAGILAHGTIAITGEVLGTSKQGALNAYTRAIEAQEKYTPDFHDDAASRAVLKSSGRASS
jgi:hypothetical protein